MGSHIRAARERAHRVPTASGRRPARRDVPCLDVSKITGGSVGCPSQAYPRFARFPDIAVRVLAFTAVLAASPALASEPDVGEPVVGAFDQLTLEGLLAAPIVEAASKRKQSLEEAPGAITVIEGDELLAAGPL